MPNESSLYLAKHQLVEDFNKVIGDSEALLHALATYPSEKTEALRASVEENLRTARERVQQLQDNTTAAARATDTYVHDNAWAMMGVAAAVGFVAGLAIGGGRRSEPPPA
jgi:ElaB/YqjD/DUF883 family membrane-anchored ribosome-binding protein